MGEFECFNHLSYTFYFIIPSSFFFFFRFPIVMAFTGASNRLHGRRVGTFQHILKDVFQYRPPTPLAAVKRRCEWTFVTTTFIDPLATTPSLIVHPPPPPLQNTLITTPTIGRNVALTLNLKNYGVHLLCFKFSAGRLTLILRKIDTQQLDFEYGRRVFVDTNFTCFVNINNVFSPPHQQHLISYGDSPDDDGGYDCYLDNDLFCHALPPSLTPSVSSSSSSSADGPILWENDDPETSFFHLVHDTLQYIHSFPTYSDELQSLAPKLDDYLEITW